MPEVILEPVKIKMEGMMTIRIVTPNMYLKAFLLKISR